jgi:transcriptional regulator with XRE-family HTH domain
MTEPQMIRISGGEELIALPRAEYHAFLERADHDAEDADDIAIYHARPAELANGGVVLPPAVSAAMLRGESRLKAIRSWRGKTQIHLNIKAGIGHGYMSDLENGRCAGTPETIAKLAPALVCGSSGFPSPTGSSNACARGAYPPTQRKEGLLFWKKRSKKLLRVGSLAN